MKVLIAISSCFDFEKNGNNQAMRDTWLPDVAKFHGLEYRFFFGKGQGAERAYVPDAVFLPDVLDDYGNLTYKTRASLRWALERNYDYVFRCFPDTYVRIDRLMACGFRSFHYYGDFRGDPSTNEVTHQRAQNYASGGPGYFLERTAYAPLIDAPVLGVWRDEITPYTEDLWVGNRLGISKVPLKYFDDTHRFINRGSRPCAWPSKKNDFITAHLSCPDHPGKDWQEIGRRMRAAHKEWQ